MVKSDPDGRAPSQGMVVQAYNPTSREMETGGSRVQSWLLLSSEFEASLG